MCGNNASGRRLLLCPDELLVLLAEGGSGRHFLGKSAEQVLPTAIP